MRIAALLMTALVFAAACDRKETTAPPPAVALNLVEAPVSDELPGLPGPATGIAFWDHPTLSFNSTMIIATLNGVVSYSMEDGNEVSRIDGVNAQGVSTGYLGFGPQAVGFVVFLDADENAFKFYGVDNNSRVFIPLDAGPIIRGAVRGFCVGRGDGSPTSSLYVVQNSKIQVFNLTPNPSGLAFASEAIIETPDNLVSCAVGLDGALLAAAENGAIFKVSGDNPFANPFALASVEKPGSLSVIAATAEDDPSSVSGEIVFADLATGILHLLDASSGDGLGAVRIAATDSLPGVDRAAVFAITGGNLGGLYRNGVAAFGLINDEEEPVVRIAPVSGLKNALSLPVGEAVSPRGAAPKEEESGLNIPTNYTPE